jgi:hypothetical protein
VKTAVTGPESRVAFRSNREVAIHVPDLARGRGMALALILCARAALALGCLLWGLSRPASPEAVHCFRCPGCRRKLRYAAHKAGRRGICPRCKSPCSYPTEPIPVGPASAPVTSFVRRAATPVATPSGSGASVSCGRAAGGGWTGRTSRLWWDGGCRRWAKR